MDSVFAGNEFDDEEAAAGPEGGADAAEQGVAAGEVEVMKNVGQEDEIVIGAKIDVEGRAGSGFVAIGDVGCGGIAAGEFENVGPVDGQATGLR